MICGSLAVGPEGLIGACVSVNLAVQNGQQMAILFRVDLAY